jgi:hypothetical protein
VWQILAGYGYTIDSKVEVVMVPKTVVRACQDGDNLDSLTDIVFK